MPVERILSEAWLPKGRNVRRVVLHWTAGRNQPSALDRAHYHFLIDGLGVPYRGLRGPGLYLPHVRAFNTGSVGLALCGMFGAVQGRTDGPCPLTEPQVERACQAAAEILVAYGLTLSERTVLCHSEVERVYGVPQRGKWDIDRLPFYPHYGKTPAEVHALLRRKVAWYLRTYHGVKTEVIW